MKKIMFAIILMLSNIQAYAGPILSSFTSPAVFFSQSHTLGYAFSSDSNASVSALGFWDSSLDGFASSHRVGLWNGVGALLGQVSLSAGTGNTLINDFRYASLNAAVNLNAGETYYLAGTTANDAWVYQASNIVMDTGINYLGSYFVSNTFDFPANFASDRQYMTVNAIISDVPEPSALLLLTFALAGVVFSRKRKLIRRN
ncbi:DUF4082 domain-containing protein [Psychromonas ossibalaenae]|uniref:DUF4082 domain-containing protein n=1 Tax=Psychromonas ossibalaenae TaxID=444922 RepID=UPI000382EA86|nr:DUF4082 domain-containing protein [Psychromonas ossibalaenae]